MKENIRVVEVNDFALWDEFINSSAQCSVFSSSSWVRAASKAYNGKPIFLGIKEQDKLVAGVSFTEISKGPFNRATTPVLTPYGGFLYADGQDGKKDSLNMLCAESLIAHLQKKYNHIFLVHSPGFCDVRPFQWQGWKEKIRYTYILDLTDKDMLWEKIRKTLRAVIVKAEESLDVVESDDIQRIKKIYAKSLTESGKTGTPSGMSMKLLELIVEAGIAKAFIAVSKGIDIALGIAVSDSSRVYTWAYGSVKNASPVNPDSLIVWSIAKKYLESKKELDLVGANIQKVAMFKKGFGGVLTPYYVTECYSSKTIHTSFNLYSGFRKLIGR